MIMGRLTKRDEFGNADIIGVNSMDLQCNLEFDEFNKVTNALNKLARYEDLEENNKKIIITEDCMDYGNDNGTLEKLLPTMLVAVAYTCKKLNKPVLNAVSAITQIYTKNEKLEDFGYESED